MHPRPWLFCLSVSFLVFGCASTPNSSSDADAGGSGASESTTEEATTASAPSTTGSTTDLEPPAADPIYPAPVPYAMTGQCPPGTDGPFDLTSGLVCTPACGEAMTCPFATTGSAVGSCVFHPYDSGAPCMPGRDDDCEVEGESCEPAAVGGHACFAPPSHCLLLCGPTVGQCPDSMACNVLGICEYLMDPN